MLLLIFGMLRASLDTLMELFVPTTALVLCFIMRLHNAIATKISRAEIRTRQMTGVITDLGIKLGRLVYWNQGPRHREPVRADRDRLVTLATILGLFLGRGRRRGRGVPSHRYTAVLPVAAALVAVSAIPLIGDARRLWHSFRRFARERCEVLGENPNCVRSAIRLA